MKRIRSLVFNRALPVRLVFVTIWLSLFAYAGRPLLVAAHLGGMARPAAWTILVAIAFTTLLPLVERRKPMVNWIGYVTLAIFSTLLVLVALSDVVRLILFLAQVAIPAQAVSFAILGAAAVMSAIGLIQARCPKVKRVNVAIENLPEELIGYRIVQWSDVHVGPTIQRGFLQALVERTNALDADAIAITGDLIDGYVDDLREHVQPLAGLRARDGVFYVTGNHE